MESIAVRTSYPSVFDFLLKRGPPYMVATKDKRVVRYSHTGTRMIFEECTVIVLRTVTRAEYVTRYPECAIPSLREAGWFEILVD